MKQQVQDQAAAEHSHWLRQQRLEAYEGFLEAWDECLRLTHHPSDLHDPGPSSFDALRMAAGRMAERARRIALLGPLEVTQAAENLTETIQQDVDATAEFVRTADAGLASISAQPDRASSLEAATQDLEERTGQLQEIWTNGVDPEGDIDSQRLMAEVMESSERIQATSSEAVGELRSNVDLLSTITDQAAAMVELLTRNQAARERSRAQFTSAAGRALGSSPLPQASDPRPPTLSV
ncbi:hypothetical protein ACFVX6_24145 [Streptomyces sp. NPDC058289]|uniref:hypothetical protein n=1 Tax=Streptomyces sp. NPDC058289 TaxID=3346425 RepID=UPI0036E6C535